MIDQRTFTRHSRKTQQAIRKILVRFEPHARHDSRDPVESSLDELREILLTLERCEKLFKQATVGETASGERDRMSTVAPTLEIIGVNKTQSSRWLGELSPREITPADAAEISKVLANAAKAFEIAEIAERAQLERMTDEGLLCVIAMGDNGNEITKQVSGLLTIGPAARPAKAHREGSPSASTRPRSSK
jgi:hypothetical protein